MDFFTIDLDDNFAPSTGQKDGLVWECETCHEWFTSMREAYSKPRFCVRTIENEDDLRPYRGRNMDWLDDLLEDSQTVDNDKEY